MLQDGVTEEACRRGLRSAALGFLAPRHVRPMPPKMQPDPTRRPQSTLDAHHRMRRWRYSCIAAGQGLRKLRGGALKSGGRGERSVGISSLGRRVLPIANLSRKTDSAPEAGSILEYLRASSSRQFSTSSAAQETNSQQPRAPSHQNFAPESTSLAHLLKPAKMHSLSKLMMLALVGLRYAFPACTVVYESCLVQR